MECTCDKQMQFIPWNICVYCTLYETHFDMKHCNILLLWYPTSTCYLRHVKIVITHKQMVMYATQNDIYIKRW